jgi:hypothetical protein
MVVLSLVMRASFWIAATTLGAFLTGTVLGLSLGATIGTVLVAGAVGESRDGCSDCEE